MGGLLLDTHIFYWAITKDPSLSKPASRLISTTPDVYISVLSLFELKIKGSAGKMRLPENLLSLATDHDVHVLDFTPKQLAGYTVFHAKNPDPFGNALLAIAEKFKYQFLTADRKIIRLQKTCPWIIAA
jgi:PIN domain nuclease of toxin-antitoxin system